MSYESEEQPRYAKSNNGLIHLLSALNCEFTLCGNAFEGDGTDIINIKNDPNAHTRCKKGPVTCENCIKEIKNARHVKIKESHNDLRIRRTADGAGD